MKLVTLLNIILIFFCVSFVGAQTNPDVFQLARTGTLEQVKIQFKNNPKAFSVISSEGYSPLIIACYKGNNDVAKFLVENGCDVNVRSSMGTALMACIVKGNQEMASYLVEHKADVNLGDDNQVTPLIFASMFKNKKIVSLLLANGADKNLKDNQGKTAFEYAVFSGDDDLINLLK